MILIVSLIKFRANDYLLLKQVLSQTEQRMDRVQRSPTETFTRIPGTAFTVMLGPIRSRSALFQNNWSAEQLLSNPSRNDHKRF
jgi:hypothetical protein